MNAPVLRGGDLISLRWFGRSGPLSPPSRSIVRKLLWLAEPNDVPKSEGNIRGAPLEAFRRGTKNTAHDQNSNRQLLC